MRFRRPVNPRLLRLSFVFFILSMLVHGLALRSPWMHRLNEDLGDRLHGLFLGLFIGLMIMAFRTGAQAGSSVCARKRQP